MRVPRVLAAGLLATFLLPVGSAHVAPCVADLPCSAEDCTLTEAEAAHLHVTQTDGLTLCLSAGGPAVCAEAQVLCDVYAVAYPVLAAVVFPLLCQVVTCS